MEWSSCLLVDDILAIAPQNSFGFCQNVHVTSNSRGMKPEGKNILELIRI